MPEPINPTIKSERHFLCPCGDDRRHLIDHVGAGRSAGPWYCDSCWVGWFVRISNNGVLTIEDTGYRSRKVAARVRLQPRSTHVDFIVTTYAHRDDGKRPTLDDVGDCEYFYEDGTCPSNVMRSVLEVVDGDDSDPHGLFEFVECFEHDGRG